MFSVSISLSSSLILQRNDNINNTHKFICPQPHVDVNKTCVAGATFCTYNEPFPIDLNFRPYLNCNSEILGICSFQIKKFYKLLSISIQYSYYSGVKRESVYRYQLHVQLDVQCPNLCWTKSVFLLFITSTGDWIPKRRKRSLCGIIGREIGSSTYTTIGQQQ